jgi:hypothetical protein
MWTPVRMMAGARGEVERGKWAKLGSSFGNFVFLGLRHDSGIRHQYDVDSYLHGEAGLLQLTVYGCNFVVQNSTYV